MSLTIDFSSLSTYTDQVSTSLIKNFVLPSTLMDSGINYQDGVTNVTSLNLLDSTISPKLFSCAAFSATGSTTLSQRNITVKPIIVEEESCPDKFKEYWTKEMTRPGSYNEETPVNFNELYTSFKLAQVSGYVEDSFFCGTTTGTASCGFYDSSLTLTDGILHILTLTSASQSTVVINSASYSGALTKSNAIDFFDAMVNSAGTMNIIGEKDLTLYINIPQMLTIQQAARDRNYYHIDAKMNENGDWTWKNALNSTVTIRGMRGMKYTNKAFLTTASNLYLGCDLRNDWEKIRTWYSFDNNTVRTQIKWRQGAQVAFPQWVVVKP